MYILGTLCAIGAGVFFGFIGPVTKVAYNLGVGLGLAITPSLFNCNYTYHSFYNYK